jgi:hypothetical protein
MLTTDLAKYLDVDYLKSHTEHAPHWFGLGFIQLKLNTMSRVHFWHPSLAADLPEEELHDHRYNFTSHILKGQLANVIWQFLPSDTGTLELVTVDCKPNTISEPVVIGKGHTALLASHTMHAGDSYRMYMDTFHRIHATHAITLLVRDSIQKPVARVIRNPNTPFVCPFAAPKPVDELWELITECIEND